MTKLQQAKELLKWENDYANDHAITALLRDTRAALICIIEHFEEKSNV